MNVEPAKYLAGKRRKMKIKEAMEILEKDIHIDIPKASDENKMVSLADIAVSVLIEIKEQPIAFDIQKVVKELEDLKMRYFLTLANTGDANKDCAYFNIANVIDKAIKIVKGGGIEC